MKFNRLYTLLAGAALTVAAAGGYVHYKWQQVETLTNKGPTRLFTVEKGAHAARLIAELGEGNQPLGGAALAAQPSRTGGHQIGHL